MSDTVIDEALAPIVTGVDDRYVTPLHVLLESVAVAHGQAAGPRVVVLHAGLSSQNQAQLKAHAARVGLPFEFRAVQPPARDFPISGWVSEAVYLRLAIGEALAELPRALYLDTDTIVLRDLRLLLATQLSGGLPVAAVRDPQNPVLGLGIALPGWSELGLPAEREYFNSGVMLLDLDSCRERRIFERARDFLLRHPTNIRFWDQDALNWSVDDDWQRLDRHCNTFALSPLVARGGFVHYAEAVVPLVELVAAEPMASILHFAGPDKPWRPGYPPGPVRDLYHRYLDAVTEGVRGDGQARNG